MERGEGIKRLELASCLLPAPMTKKGVGKELRYEEEGECKKPPADTAVADAGCSRTFPAPP